MRKICNWQCSIYVGRYYSGWKTRDFDERKVRERGKVVKKIIQDPDPESYPDPEQKLP